MNEYNGFSPQVRQRSCGYMKKALPAGVSAHKTCMACLRRADEPRVYIDAHAEDYSEPFGPHIFAFGFCYPCHMMIHCRFKSPNAWNRYLLTLLQGDRLVWDGKRNWYEFRKILSGYAVEWERGVNPSRKRTILHDIQDGFYNPNHSDFKPDMAEAILLNVKGLDGKLW